MPNRRDFERAAATWQGAAFVANNPETLARCLGNAAYCDARAQGKPETAARAAGQSAHDRALAMP